MDFCKNLEMAQDILPLAIATVPMQPWETPYEPAKALKLMTRLQPSNRERFSPVWTSPFM